MTGCDHTEQREKSIGSLEAVRKKINISLCGECDYSISSLRNGGDTRCRRALGRGLGVLGEQVGAVTSVLRPPSRGPPCDTPPPLAAYV